MKYTEDDLRPISALQHIIFCERQCALIHVERLWVENRLTVEGQIMHQRVNTTGSENRGQVRVEYSMKIKSYQLGLIGVADVVEFHFDENKSLKNDLKTWTSRQERRNDRPGSFSLSIIKASSSIMSEPAGISKSKSSIDGFLSVSGLYR